MTFIFNLYVILIGQVRRLHPKKFIVCKMNIKKKCCFIEVKQL